MTRQAPALVIHGHFYQPPREDPWTGEVPAQPTAAPFHDWNERITAECYRPNALGAVNTFELLSFDVGPSLLSWLEAHQRDVYEAIVAADRRAGRAIAQGYGHAVLPLCNDRDLRTHLRWGVADFRHRFERDPEGIWLPETAVSEVVLAAVAEEGLRFTILAPHQIEQVRRLQEGAEWLRPGDGQPLATDRPLRWNHPHRAGAQLDLVVYDGSLAHDLAFGEPTAREIVAAALARVTDEGGMVTAATDGETFGHHHERAHLEVAGALAEEAAHHGVRVPRLSDLLGERPPTHEARVRVSSWSCAHGVGRWWTDCGCQTGGDPDWDQAWREPLRNALDLFRDWGVEVTDRRGVALFRDVWAARDDYIDVVIAERAFADFASRHVIGDQRAARLLLEAQRNALLMYTSCGWFFNDVGGIETVQILRYAARAIERYTELGETPPLDAFLEVLGQARSNDPALGNGRRIWEDQVTRRPAWQ